MAGIVTITAATQNGIFQAAAAAAAAAPLPKVGLTHLLPKLLASKAKANTHKVLLHFVESEEPAALVHKSSYADSAPLATPFMHPCWMYGAENASRQAIIT